MGEMLLKRIDAVHKFLGSIATQPASLDIARPMQLKGLLTMIESTTMLSLDAAADANAKFASCEHWTAEEKSALIGAIVKSSGAEANAAATRASTAGRRALQDYVCLSVYFPAKLWDTLFNEVLETKKLQVLLTHVHAGPQNSQRRHAAASQCSFYALQSWQ